MIIPMENIRASQTPEALARDKKRMKEFMERVNPDELREFVEKWKKQREGNLVGDK